jgi:pimeloyl-ACP methyl ester carboxylesterase
MTNQHVIDANGVKLCVETFGHETDPAILLIMGVGSSMDGWEDELCERLAAGSRYVVRYDNRDTGRSVSSPPGKPEYSLSDLAGDAIGILDTLALRSAHLVGMSMGGMIAQLAALDHPARMESLTLISTSPANPSAREADLPPMSGELLAVFETMTEPDWSGRPAVVDYIVELSRSLAGSLPFDEAGLRSLTGRVLDRTTDIASTLTNHDIIINGPERWRARLGELRTPTLVVHGTEDPLFPLGHAEALAREIPNARLLRMEHAGHELPRAAWDVVVPAVLEHTTAG